MTLETIGARCRWARHQLHLTQAQLADLAGVSESVIGNVEAGRGGPNATIRRLTEVAEVLKVNPHWLATGEGDPQVAAGGTIMIDAGQLLPVKVSEEDMQMVLGWFATWQAADTDHRALIESVFAVAASSAAPAQRVA